jgi:AcrR family transcriptional regulator
MEYAGRGDPARTTELLWRTAGAPRRGPKQRFTIDQVVDAAIAVADAGDIAALSMRAVAQRLGIGTASLYTYLPGKAELLELMVDRLAGAQPLPDRGDDPRSALVDYATDDLDLLRGHPWVLQVATSREVLGPGVLARYEAAVGLLDGLGLTPRGTVEAVAALDAYVRGAGAVVVEAEQAASRTGRSDDEWWQARAPLLDEHFAAGRYPRLSALDAAGAFAPSRTDVPYTVQRALDRFDAGLALVLDGIEAAGSVDR